MFGKMRKSGLLMAALLVFAAVAVKPAAVKAETSVVPDESIPATISITLKDVDDEKRITLLSMQPMSNWNFRQEILGYSLLAALGISSEEINSKS